MLHLHRYLCPVDAPLALAIGNFDGVHLGHQAILEKTRNASSRLGFQPAALSFSPLPREFFARMNGVENSAPARLMSTTEKLAAFTQAGMAHVFLQRFDAEFSALAPQVFLHMLKQANVRWLLVGDDFRFGAKRAGDIAMLREWGRDNGVTIETMADVVHDGARVSSTAVRNALAAGDCVLAGDFLGRAYRIVGRVTHGKKLGRSLGFPTANVTLTARKPALHGVFAVKCRLIVTRGLEGVAGKTGVILNGVANLGTNPVVTSANRLHLEIFLFDYSGDLYGQRLEVVFIEKIRDELKLPDLAALVMQMRDDTAKAQEILSRTADGYFG